MCPPRGDASHSALCLDRIPEASIVHFHTLYDTSRLRKSEFAAGRALSASASPQARYGRVASVNRVGRRALAEPEKKEKSPERF